MKKILSIALVALLAASTVFAGVTGNAKVAFGYDTSSKNYGFKNSNSFDVNLDLATAEAEAKGEGDVYAGVKASVKATVGNDKFDEDHLVYAGDASRPDVTVWQKDGSAMGLGVFFNVAEAYVAGQDWKVSITGTQGAPDFAKSAIDTKTDWVKDIFGNVYDKKDVADTYKVTANDAAGVTATYKDWTASVGLSGNADKSKEVNYNAFVKTPEFAFAEDAVKVQVAAIASGKGTSDKTETKYDDATGIYTVTKTKNGNPAYDAFGASAKVAFENDTLKGSVATDFGAKKNRVDGAKFEVGLDAAVNFVISPVTLDVYFKNTKLTEEKFKDNTLLSAQTVVDLNAFDVPVALTVKGKDLIRKQDLSLKAAFNITEELSADASVGYAIKDKKFSTSANVAYATDAFTAKAGVAYSTIIETEKSNVLSATASIETAALIPGAKLALEYGKDSDDADMNFLKDQTASKKNQNFGAITASCKIAF